MQPSGPGNGTSFATTWLHRPVPTMCTQQLTDPHIGPEV